MTSADRRRKLDAIDIIEPPELAGLIKEVFNPQGFSFSIEAIFAPVYVYREKLVRNEYGFIVQGSQIECYIANEKGSGTISYGTDRTLLRFSGTRFDDSNRGKVLVAFCEIEFIVDVLLLHDYGVYDGQVGYAEFYEKMVKTGDSPFHSFENKKRYLSLKRSIRPKTVEYLGLVQKIRNHTAHQFFLDKDVGLGESLPKGYSSTTDAVEIIFNKCWILLLQDYNPLQVNILKAISRKLSADV